MSAMYVSYMYIGIQMGRSSENSVRSNVSMYRLAKRNANSLDIFLENRIQLKKI